MVLKWIKRMITRKKHVPIPTTIAQDFNQTWYEMQTLKKELADMTDNDLASEIVELSEMFLSTRIIKLLENYNGTLEPETRKELEQFYIFVNQEMGLNAN